MACLFLGAQQPPISIGGSLVNWVNSPAFSGFPFLAKATFDAISKTYSYLTPDLWKETVFTKSPYQVLPAPHPVEEQRGVLCLGAQLKVSCFSRNLLTIL